MVGSSIHNTQVRAAEDAARLEEQHKREFHQKKKEESKKVYLEKRKRSYLKIRSEKAFEKQEKLTAIIEKEKADDERIRKEEQAKKEAEIKRKAKEKAEYIAREEAKKEKDKAIVKKTSSKKTDKPKVERKESAPKDKRVATFEVTAYAIGDGLTPSTVTANGTNVANTIYSPEGYRIIAVDTSVIPMNSIVEVHIEGQAPFKAKASDTGSAINGYIIDLLVDGVSTANNFGRQKAQIYY